MSSWVQFLVSASVGLSLVGCLKTRNDVREVEGRQVMQQQVTTMQKNNAEASTRYIEVDEKMRELSGRVEELENKINIQNKTTETSAQAQQMAHQESSQKVLLLQEALGKMETQLLQLTAEVQALKATDRAASSNAVTPASRKNEKDTYTSGQELFAQKDWKKAILHFQKYRDENPKGKNFADATYKIGVSFQELGMKDEAKTFYDEVLMNYGKSEAAKKAKSRIKNLK